LLATGVLADRLTTYVVGFDSHRAGAAPPELVFVSRDDSPVRVRVWLPWRHDVMRPLVALLYKDRPRRIRLPAAVRAADNGTDNKGDENCFFCHSRVIDSALQLLVFGHEMAANVVLVVLVVVVYQIFKLLKLFHFTTDCR